MPFASTIPERTCGDAAWLYASLGSRIHLPAGQKSPPPRGTTGRSAGYLSDDFYGQWYNTCRFTPGHQCFNVGLRLRSEVIALDVDAYDGHSGTETLAALVAELGPLPPTFRNTRRGAGNPSGHRLFRVPSGLEWRDAGTGLDTLWWGHRYLVVWPSIVEGQAYRWYGPDGRRMPFLQLPIFDRLPELPGAWVERLTKPKAQVPDAAPWDGAPATRSEQVRLSKELTAARLEVLNAPEGSRNATLNAVTFRLARLAAGSPLDPKVVRAGMLVLGEEVGLGPTEVADTVRSAMRSGLARPRALTPAAASSAAQSRNGEHR